MKDKEIKKLKSVMLEEHVDSNTIETVITRLIDEAELPKTKQTVDKQYVLVVSDPENKITGEFTGWALQIPKASNVTDVLGNLSKAATTFNNSRKGKRAPVTNVAEAMEFIPAITLKQESIWVKNQTPVFVVLTNNKFSR